MENLFDKWTAVPLGLASLFPMAGLLPKLKQFYPPGFRGWYTTFAGIFSVAVYLGIQWDFGSLQWYIPLPVAFGIAVIGISIYSALHLFFFKDYDSLSRWTRPPVVVGGMITFIGFTLSLTYGFNAMERLNDFRAFYGFVERAGDGRIAGAQVQMLFDGGTDLRVQTRGLPAGYFSVILSKERAAALRSIRSVWATNGAQFGTTLRGSDHANGGLLRLRLEPLGSQ